MERFISAGQKLCEHESFGGAAYRSAAFVLLLTGPFLLARGFWSLAECGAACAEADQIVEMLLNLTDSDVISTG